MNVCFESNIIDVPFDTWWLDSGATCATPKPGGSIDNPYYMGGLDSQILNYLRFFKQRFHKKN